MFFSQSSDSKFLFVLFQYLISFAQMYVISIYFFTVLQKCSCTLERYDAIMDVLCGFYFSASDAIKGEGLQEGVDWLQGTSPATVHL